MTSLLAVVASPVVGLLARTGWLGGASPTPTTTSRVLGGPEIAAVSHVAEHVAQLFECKYFVLHADLLHKIVKRRLGELLRDALVVADAGALDCSQEACYFFHLVEEVDRIVAFVHGHDRKKMHQLVCGHDSLTLILVHERVPGLGAVVFGVLLDHELVGFLQGSREIRVPAEVGLGEGRKNVDVFFLILQDKRRDRSCDVSLYFTLEI